ncbi:MAG: hypothetical protein ACI9WU_003454 [Myxococcota bacterium]
MLLFLSLLCTQYTAPAEAKDMNGKFGVGFSQTLGGVSGLSARYFATRQLAFEIDFGASFLTNDNSTDLLFAVAVLYAPVQHRHANLMVGVRVDLGLRTSPTSAQQTVTIGEAVNTETQSRTPEVGEATAQINIEIPLIVEFFFTDSFAINLAAGIVIVIAPEGGPILDVSGPGAVLEGGDVGIGIGAGGLLGSAGFTFYF